MWHVFGTERTSPQYRLSREQDVCDLRGDREFRAEERPVQSLSRRLIRPQYDTRSDQLSRAVQSKLQYDPVGDKGCENDTMTATMYRRQCCESRQDLAVSGLSSALAID